MLCCQSNLPQCPWCADFFWLSPVYCPVHCSFHPSSAINWLRIVCAKMATMQIRVVNRVCGITSSKSWSTFLSKVRHDRALDKLHTFSFLDVCSNECWPAVTSSYASRLIHSHNTRLQKNKLHVGREESQCHWRRDWGKKKNTVWSTRCRYC